MEKVIDITSKQDYVQMAVDKIAEELKNFKGDRYGEAVKSTSPRRSPISVSRTPALQR